MHDHITEHGRGGCAAGVFGAPQQRSKPRLQTSESERFDEVVVRTGVQAGHAVVHGAAQPTMP